MEKTVKIISLGSDHAGYEYKELIKKHLITAGYEIIDCGTNSSEPVDYPLFIQPAAETVAAGRAQVGIVFGGSGNGEAITANKVRGIRCAVCWNEASARLAKQHNDANMIALGQRLIDVQDVTKIVDTWLHERFEAGRHARRIAQITALEELTSGPGAV